MIGYDSGNLDAIGGTLRLRLFNVDNAARTLEVQNLRVFELPQVASI